MSEWLIGLSEYIGDMSDELDSVKAENVKLRELVRDMWPLTVPMPTTDCDTKRAAIRQRMHELGVDV